MTIQPKSPEDICKELRYAYNVKAAPSVEFFEVWLKSAMASLLVWAAQEMGTCSCDCGQWHNTHMQALRSLAKKISANDITK